MKAIAISHRLLAAIVFAAAVIIPIGYFVPLLGHVVQTIGLFFFPGACIVSLSRLNVRRMVLLFVITVAASIGVDLVVFGAVDLVTLALGSRTALTDSNLKITQTFFWLALSVVIYFAGDEVKLSFLLGLLPVMPSCFSARPRRLFSPVRVR